MAISYEPGELYQPHLFLFLQIWTVAIAEAASAPPKKPATPEPSRVKLALSREMRDRLLSTFGRSGMYMSAGTASQEWLVETETC